MNNINTTYQVSNLKRQIAGQYVQIDSRVNEFTHLLKQAVLQMQEDGFIFVPKEKPFIKPVP